MKKLLLAVVIIIAVYAYSYYKYTPSLNDEQPSVSEQGTGSSDAINAGAYLNHESGLQVSGRGTGIKLLTDDDSGSRHQRFIVKFTSRGGLI